MFEHSLSPWRRALRFVAVLIVKHLQRRYKSITEKNRHNQSNQILARLKLIQSILYYFKCQFSAWGYFHPGCVWDEADEAYFRRLFPRKDFDELPIVVWHNPEAVTYYKNKIFELSNQRPPDYAREIKRQLTKWDKWN